MFERPSEHTFSKLMQAMSNKFLIKNIYYTDKYHMFTVYGLIKFILKGYHNKY